MARPKGTVNTGTMLKVLEEAGMNTKSLGQDRARIQPHYDRIMAMRAKKDMPRPAAPAMHIPNVVDVLEANYPEGFKKSIEAAVNKPVEKSAFIKRLDALKAAAMAKVAEYKANAKPPVAPPMDPKELRDTTRIEGKTVNTWNKLVEKMEEKGGIWDSTVDMPGWSYWAVEKWRANGCPTKKAILSKQAQDILEEAGKLDKFAKMDRSKADKERKFDSKKADKLVENAVKKEAKAAELRAEAQKIMEDLV